MKIHRGNFESNKLFLNKANVLQPHHKILEIGAGHGVLVKYLLDCGFSVVGAEINQDYIKSAKENFNINLISINGKVYPFEDNSFDAVMSFDVFEHIPNTESHLKEVKRILKKGGYYLLGTPNKITNIPFEVLKEKGLTKWKKYHCSLHTYWQLKKAFREAGFEVDFIDVPVVNDFFKDKIKKYTGSIGLKALSLCNPDKFPMYLRTNFYVKTVLLNS